MAQRLKRWESPRREGRNDKGKGGSARQRQKLKQLKALRRKLKESSGESGNANSRNLNRSLNNQNLNGEGSDQIGSSLFFV